MPSSALDLPLIPSANHTCSTKVGVLDESEQRRVRRHHASARLFLGDVVEARGQLGTVLVDEDVELRSQRQGVCDGSVGIHAGRESSRSAWTLNAARSGRSGL